MPFYADHVLDEVRNSVNIVSVISEYVELKKRGRNYLARCPFHNEKTPSFNVNEDRQIFMCFGCREGGDVFKFLMKMEGLSFPEAVQFLAERRGIPLPVVMETSDKPGIPSSTGDVLRKAMAETVVAYQQALMSTSEGKPALEYLRGRGITIETITKFQLGFSPADGNFLVSLLGKKGFTIGTLEECGLCRKSDDGSRVYDYFRGRVMFPITDIQGRTIAFGARAMNDHPPKYLNSPETRLYNKSRNLFGLSYSRDAIRRRGQAVLVEGYMDFVVPFQYGVENVVASLGTSLTPQQVELLGRYAHDVVVSYDPDSAGQHATQRSLDLFLEGDFRVRVLRLPEGQDPDLYVRSAGAEAYRKREEEAVPYLEFVLESAIKEQGGMDDPKKKVQILNAVLPYLARLTNAVERSEYAFRFARRLGIEDQQLLAETRKAAQQKMSRLAKESEDSAASMKPAEKRLLQLLLIKDDLQDQILPHCSREYFEGLAGERIFSIILDEFEENRRSSFGSLNKLFAGEPEQALLVQLEIEELPESPSADAAESYLNALRIIRLEAHKRRIVSEITEASARNDDEKLNRLLERRSLIDRELISLSRK